MNNTAFIAANDSSMELFGWINEVENRLRYIRPNNAEARSEQAQHIRTLRWLHSLELDNE